MLGAIQGSSIHLLGVSVALVLLNAVVSLAIVRDSGLTATQRVVQLAVVWFIPFLGAVLMLALVGSHHTRPEMKAMVPFPFYLVGRPHLKAKVKPNPLDGGGTEGHCGGSSD